MKRIIDIVRSAVICLVAAACSSDGIENANSSLLLQLRMPEKNSTRVSIVPYGTGEITSKYKWQENDLFDLYFVEYDRKKVDAMLSVAIDNISQDGQNCDMQLYLREQPQSRLAIYGVTGAPVGYHSGRVCVGLNLTRTDEPQRIPMYFNLAVEPGEGVGNNICSSLMAYEVLHVRNLSGRVMAFKLHGPVADNLWYYENAVLYLATTHEPPILTDEKITDGMNQSSPVVNKPGQVYYANPDDEVRIYSWYRPNGMKLKDVSMVADINGERVQTSNTLSSDLSVEVGNIYHMYCVWDGQRFTFGRNSTEEDAENGLIEGGAVGYQSPDAWIHGTGGDYDAEHRNDRLDGTGSGYYY